MNQRRRFLGALGAAALATPLLPFAQQPARKVRIGLLGPESASGSTSRLEALRAGLRELGYVEGTNLVTEYRFADGRYERLPELARDLVRSKVDVIVTSGTPGLSQMAPELAGKRLELLKEMVPKLSRVAVLWNPQGVGSQLNWKEIQLPARQLGAQLHSLEVRSPDDFDKAFEDAARARAGALFLTGDPVIITNLNRIVDLVEQKAE